MRYRPLGGGGPDVSVVCFGTWPAGGLHWGAVDDAEVTAALRSAIDLGINFFDTADAYGWGHAEELLAGAVGPRRDAVFIATKVGIRRRGFSLAPHHIRKACEASLRRLATDRIDLYQIHWPGDPSTPLEDSWDTMVRLQEAGKVRLIGVSNFDPAELGVCEAIRHVDSVQNEYSMLVRDPEEGVLDWCRARQTGFLSYGSLAYGLLTGKFEEATRFARSDWRSGSQGFEYYDRLFAPKPFAANLRRVERLRAIAGDLALTAGQLAVAWLLRDEVVTSAICGAKNPRQIAETAAAADVELDSATLAAVQEALADP